MKLPAPKVLLPAVAIVLVAGTVAAVILRSPDRGPGDTGSDPKTQPQLRLSAVQPAPVTIDPATEVQEQFSQSQDREAVTLIEEVPVGDEPFDRWMSRNQLDPEPVAPLADLDPSIPANYGEWRLVDLVTHLDHWLLLYGDSFEGQLEVCYVFFVDRIGGEVRYGLDLGEIVREQSSYTSPVIFAAHASDLLVLMYSNGRTYAIRPNDGRVVWHRSNGPVLRRADGGLLFGYSDGLVVLSATSGRTLQIHPLGPVQELPTITIPGFWVAREQLLVRSDTTTYRFSINAAASVTDLVQTEEQCDQREPCASPSDDPA